MTLSQRITQSGFARYVFYLFLVSVFSLISYKLIPSVEYGTDDALISFTYAKNLANGHGIVYNVGSERIEGFSSLLYMFYEAFLYLFTDNIQFLLVITNILLVAGTLTLLTGEIKNTFGLRADLIHWFIIPFVAWMLICPDYITWNVFSLFETALWTFLLASVFVVSLRWSDVRDIGWREHIWSGLVLFGLVFTRPDSLVWGIAFIALMTISRFLSGRKLVDALKPVFIQLLVFIALVVVITLFRLWYFGYPLPNTYYTKVSPNKFYVAKLGLDYIFSYFEHNRLAFPLLMWGIFVGAVIVRDVIIEWRKGLEIRLSRQRRFIIGSLVMLWVGMVIILHNGGDHFGQYRYFQYVLPFLWFPVMGAGSVVKVRILAKGTAWFGLPLLGFVFFMSFETKYTDIGAAKREAHMDEEFVVGGQVYEGGLLFNQFFEGETLPSVGVISTGGFGFTYKGFTYDLLGLNWLEMGHSENDRVGYYAHAAFHAPVLLKHQPDIIKVFPIPNAIQSDSSVNSELLKGIFPELFGMNRKDWSFLKNLEKMEEFHQKYVAGRLYNKKNNTCIFAHFSRRYAQKISSNPNLILTTYERIR